MSKPRHWHWGLIVGVFVMAYLVASRSAAIGFVG